MQLPPFETRTASQKIEIKKKGKTSKELGFDSSSIYGATTQRHKLL